MVTLEEALNGAKRAVSLRRAGSNKVETYQVKIPRGVREGQRIRLAGQGEAGRGRRERAAICFCACVWRGILTLRSKAMT